MRLHGATPGPRTLLALGNPTADGEQLLPETEREVHELAEIYGASSRVYLGGEAGEDRWKSEAPNYRVVHLATDGVLDDASPLYSHLRLADPRGGSAEDGLLEAWEIMNVPLKAELVILSACETARGRIAAGEGMLGLMWAVFVAGSPATLVSQWRVDSASSTALMVGFHRAWNTGGMSKARALQATSIAVLRTPAFSHPFYWAGFILAGDGR
jgi:CHAT domain-containing protein